MEVKLPFSRRDEKLTPEDLPKTPEDTLNEYLQLLLGEERTSAVIDGDLIVLRTASEDDAAEIDADAMAVIDYHLGEAEEITHQTFLVAAYEDGQITWNVYEREVEQPQLSAVYENDPQVFVRHLERFFGDQLEAAGKTE